jgi:HEAT repeat protein
MAASVLSKLYKLLSDGETEKRVAAAIVLGELAPKEAKAVSLLAEAARDTEPELQLRAIEALGKIGSDGARDALYPFLDSGGEPRRVAIDAVALTGAPAVAFIKKRFPTATLSQKNTYLRVLATQRSKDSMGLVLDILESEHGTIAEQVVDVFREESATIDADTAKALAAQIRRAMTRQDFSASSTAIGSAVQLLNIFHDPGSTKVLLEFSGAGHPPHLRRTALHALRWVLPNATGRDAAVKTLLGYLEGDDFQNVVAPALEALSGLDIPDAAGKELIELTASRHPMVRKFALTKMSTVNDEQVTRTLVAALSDGDPMIRELSGRSLQHQREAWKILLDELTSCTDEDLAWRIVHAIRVEDATVDEVMLTKLMKTAVDRLESGQSSAEPMLHLVQAFDADLHFETLHKRGMYWKKKEKYAQAESLLSPLTRSERCTDDARFDLAVVSLRTSTATAGAIARDSDVALNIIRGLIRSGEFPVLRRINGEKGVLEPNDFYYLGFHLVEGPKAEREIGENILNRLAEDSPRSKVGKSAKSKLRIEGLA